MGFGLPLLKYHAELTGGSLKIESETGKGTKVSCTFFIQSYRQAATGRYYRCPNNTDRSQSWDKILSTVMKLIMGNSDFLQKKQRNILK